MTPAVLSPSVLFGFTAALHQAHTSGMLALLCRAGSQTAEELAQTLGLDARAAALVLRLLAASGLVVRDEKTFMPSAALVAYFADLPGGAEMDAKLWAHLQRLLVTGEPFELPDREAVYSQVAGQIGERWRRDAERLSAALPADIGRCALDVGCGSGVWSLMLAKRRPDLLVTGLDFPGVLDSFAHSAKAAGLRERVQLLPGDAFLYELAPGSFDLVVIANLLRLEPEHRAQALIAKLATAVAPGGAMLIVDAFAAGSEKAELARTVYALHLALRERHGNTHEETQVRSWLAAAGFAVVQAVALDGGFSAVGALFARRQP